MIFSLSNKLSYNQNKIFEDQISNNYKKFLEKPVLIESYLTMYDIIKNHIKDNDKTLEIGSGFGYLKKYLPNIITSDYQLNQFVDIELNAYETKFKDNTFDNIIMIDVFHHLEYPNAALKEFNRILKKNGHIIVADVNLGIIPLIIFKLFHHEPIKFNHDISINELNSKENNYFANQSYYKRIIINDELNLRSKYFELIKEYRWSDFRYILSGGFSKKKFFRIDFLIYYID